MSTNIVLYFVMTIFYRAFMVYSDDPLSAAETIATKGMPELLETDKNGCSATFPTLNRSSFSTFYRVMFNQLIDCIKTMAPAKQTDSREVYYVKHENRNV